MPDPVSVAGFISKGIQIAITQILHHANIARCCRKELDSLRDLVTSIEPLAIQIRLYRLELNKKRGTSIAASYNNASQWVSKLHDLLQRALPVVQKCTIPRFDIYSRYQMSRKISGLISEIKKHLALVPLVLLEQQTQMHMEKHAESAQASTSSSASAPQAPTRTFFIEEALIVGQDQAFATLEQLVIDAEVNTVFRTGVVGKGGSGKTLLFKRIFNSEKVRDLFRDDLLLWLTVSQSPSFSSLRNDLCKQIAVQAKAAYDQNMNQEDVKRWLSERLQEKRFALFLDDVWGDGGKLQEELGLSSLSQHSNSKIIVSSRNRRALREMGVADASALTMGDLSEKQSWELFAHHAFPYNNGFLPANMEERRAKAVCDKCGGLPLAIKVIGRTMAGISDPQEWELAVLRLPNANIQDHQALNDRLRWSYDALACQSPIVLSLLSCLQRRSNY